MRIFGRNRQARGSQSGARDIGVNAPLKARMTQVHSKFTGKFECGCICPESEVVDAVLLGDHSKGLLSVRCNVHQANIAYIDTPIAGGEVTTYAT